jgi:hypothetical protein
MECHDSQLDCRWISEGADPRARRQSSLDRGRLRRERWPAVQRQWWYPQSYNNDQRNGTSFWQGDGFTDNKGTHDMLYEDLETWGNCDAGFDLKSANTTLRRCIARDNKENFKLWYYPKTLIDCRSIRPFNRGDPSVGTPGMWHVEVMGTSAATSTGGANITLTRFTWQIESGTTWPSLVQFTYNGSQVTSQDEVVTDGSQSVRVAPCTSGAGNCTSPLGVPVAWYHPETSEALNELTFV